MSNQSLSLLDEFFRDNFLVTPRSGYGVGQSQFSPRVDLKEEVGQYVLTADVPGLNQKDVKVEYNDGVLVISGKREHEKEERKDDFISRERYMGNFQRSFNLGRLVNPDGIEAEMKDGVLKVHLPKKEELRPRSIEIKERAK